MIAGALLGVGCGDDGDKQDGDKADSGPGDGDGDVMLGDGDGDGDVTPGDGDGDQPGNDAGPVTGCSTGGAACEGATPVCLNDVCVTCTADNATACGADKVCDTTAHSCVECTATDLSKCSAGEVCDTASHTCVDKYGSFQLDCANLPTPKVADGECQGGPREVLLAQHQAGMIAMLDPIDGHFLGWFKRDRRKGEHWFATQGPDQCIWTAVDDDEYYEELPNNDAVRAIERWDTNGKFINEVINQNTKKEDVAGIGKVNVVDAPYSLAFTHDSVYVASTSGSPAARLSRWSLKGEYKETVLDDGTVPEFLIVTNDGSKIVANSTTGNIELIAPDNATRRTIYTGLTVGQIAYAGNGKLLVTDQSTSDPLVTVDIESGQATLLYPEPGGGLNSWGVAPLQNGKYLFSGGYPFGGLSTIDPNSQPNTGVVKENLLSGYEEGAIRDIVYFNYIGRACLPTAFVESRAPGLDLPVPDTQCDKPAGVPAFFADFEEEDLDGFTDYEEGVAAGSRNATLAFDELTPGEISLKIDGGSDLYHGDESGVYADLGEAGIKPSYIEYSVMVDNALMEGGTLTLGEALNGNYLDRLWISEAYYGSEASLYENEISLNEWHRIQLRDINWETYTYDAYLDCERVANDVSFDVYNHNPIYRIELSNYTTTGVAWFDNIIIQ